MNDGNSGANYTVTSNATVAGTINKAALTITPVTDTKTYDGLTASSLKPSVAGLQDVDTASALAQSFDSRNAGTRALSVNGFTVNDGNSGANYTVTSNATVAGTINQAPLTLKTDDSSRVYGNANLAFSSQLTGFVAGETPTSAGVTGVASYATLADARSNVGTYAVTPGAGTLVAGNYRFSTFEPGNLRVGQRNLVVMGDNVVRFEDELNPSPFKFSTNETGLVNGDALSGAVITVPPDSLAAKGGYVFSLVASQAGFANGLASNYALNYSDGLLLVLPRPPKVALDTDNNPAFFVLLDPNEIERTTAELKLQQEVLARPVKTTQKDRSGVVIGSAGTGAGVTNVPTFTVQTPVIPLAEAKFDLDFVRQMPLLSMDERLANPLRQP